MTRTLGLGAILAASCAAGALALAPTQAYVFAHFSSAAIDAQAHAQGIAVAMLAFGAAVVGFALSGMPPFVDRGTEATRAHAEGYAAVQSAIASRKGYVLTHLPSGSRVRNLDTGRFVSVPHLTATDAKPRRRKTDRMAVGEGA